MLKNFYHNNKLIEQDLEKSNLLQNHNIHFKKNVNINKLLNRVKVDKQIESKKNFITLSLVLLTISLMGIFLSVVN